MGALFLISYFSKNDFYLFIDKFYTKEIDKYNWVENEENNNKHLFFGSSTIRYGIDVDLFDSLNETRNTVNFAMDARDPVVNYLILKRFGSRFKNKTIYMGLDPWIYSKNYYQHRGQIMFFDLKPTELYYFIRENRVNLLKSTFRVFKFYFRTFNKQINLTPPKGRGSAKLKRKAVNFTDNQDFFRLNKFGWSEIQFEYLHKIIEHCKVNKINLIFLLPPKRQDYNYFIQTQLLTEHNYWWKKFSRIANGEKLIGFYNTLEGYNQDSIFAEAYHLNEQGQNIYTTWLSKNLNNYRIVGSLQSIIE
jgi:hypothetical protein